MQIAVATTPNGIRRMKMAIVTDGYWKATGLVADNGPACVVTDRTGFDRVDLDLLKC